MGGREQHQQERNPAIGDGGVAVEAEQLLHADFERRAVFGGVVDGTGKNFDHPFFPGWVGDVGTQKFHHTIDLFLLFCCNHG